MNRISVAVSLILLSVLVTVDVSGQAKVKVGGHVGEQIDLCVSGRVMRQDVDELIEPFRHHDDNWSWKTEFIGKWLLGAIESYRYNSDPALLEKIRYAAQSLIATQGDDGYIGNYMDNARLTKWDIWGRKYTALSLLSYYRISGDGKVLDAVEKSIGCLMRELQETGTDIADTGYYFGMASCSVLEPVVYLYRETGKQEYLDFAMGIAASIEREGSSCLVTKALDGVPVSMRSGFPSSWWSFENGRKAYEMMSCYEGLVELGQVTGNPEYMEAACRTMESIIRDEINIAGSGAAFECWYMGRELQTVPAYHTMETCVTFTWMQFCTRMLRYSGEACYADLFERTMYNALLASMKCDGSQISKYSPLEGHRHQGEEQCGLHINCCNANGPRGFALIPQMAVRQNGDIVSVNLYLPSESVLAIGKNKVKMNVETAYPVDGNVRIEFSSGKASDFTLALRIPQWCREGFSVSVNGKEPVSEIRNGYLYVSRRWKDGDVLDVDMDIRTKVERMNGMQAIVRGPLVFARDSRFGDGDVDESAVVQADASGVIDASPVVAEESFCWLDIQIPMVLGTNLEGRSGIELIHFCDFASAGNDWEKTGRYRVWIPQTLHVMSEPYHRY